MKAAIPQIFAKVLSSPQNTAEAEISSLFPKSSLSLVAMQTSYNGFPDILGPVSAHSPWYHQQSGPVDVWSDQTWTVDQISSLQSDGPQQYCSVDERSKICVGRSLPFLRHVTPRSLFETHLWIAPVDLPSAFFFPTRTSWWLEFIFLLNSTFWKSSFTSGALSEFHGLAKPLRRRRQGRVAQPQLPKQDWVAPSL